jgi:hypothetical protein
MGFESLLGYRHDEPARAKYKQLPKLAVKLNIDEPYTQWQAPMLVQQYSDCVERSTTSRMRARIVMQRTPEQRAAMALPDLPSARWAYWQYLESIGQLGTDPGTRPWDLIELLNERGWCSERWMPYTNDDGSAPPLDATAAPPPEALHHAFDQRGELRAHQIFDTFRELPLAIRHDLGVMIPFACDNRLVSSGGIPDDPDYVWNYDEGSGLAGWHMIQVEGYDPAKGLLCANTWGPQFGFDGRMWLGWDTVRNPLRAGLPIALDWVPQTSEEVADAFAGKGTV